MAVRELGAERILYGSDAGGRSFASQLAKVTGADDPRGGQAADPGREPPPDAGADPPRQGAPGRTVGRRSTPVRLPGPALLPRGGDPEAPRVVADARSAGGDRARQLPASARP